MTKISEKSPGNHTKTPNKPSGRNAKRMAFYATNRRKALGRVVIKQIRAVVPTQSIHKPDSLQSASLPCIDELEPIPFGSSYRPELYTKVIEVTQTKEDFERLRKSYEQPSIKA